MDQLLEEAYSLKREIDAKTTRLREINRQIAEQVEFDGKKSCWITGQHVKAKITLRDNVKWDQQRLVKVRDQFQHFTDAFKAEYKPISSKALEVACVNPDFAKAIEWARTITSGAPSVTYELVNMEESNAA